MVEVKDRKENAVLGRVEMEFSVNHDGKPTPSRNELIAMVAKQEPGAKQELIVITKVNTRFGQSHTSALAHIYSDKEKMDDTEAKYLLAKHAVGDDASEDSSAEEVTADESKVESDE